MVSKVIITKFAQNQLRQYLKYILEQFKSTQAAKAVKEDALETKKQLLAVSDSLKYCDDSELKDLGYKTIHFNKHNYFFVYSVRDNIAYIEAVYHDLQDYENLFKKDVLKQR